MRSQRQSVFAIAIATGLLALGCAPKLAIPRATDFRGESGGCGDFFAYRFNDDKTLAMTVFVDEKAVTLTDGPVEIEIGHDNKRAAVGVLQFRRPAIHYFCDDVAGDPPPVAEWQAIAGTITVKRNSGKPPSGAGNATHSVSVVLTNVQIKNIKTEEIVVLGEVRIDEVWVGWRA
jgi:hypothetical protein